MDFTIRVDTTDTFMVLDMLEFSVRHHLADVFARLMPCVYEEYQSDASDMRDTLIFQIVDSCNVDIIQTALSSHKFESHENQVIAFMACTKVEVAELLLKHYQRIPNEVYVKFGAPLHHTRAVATWLVQHMDDTVFMPANAEEWANQFHSIYYMHFYSAFELKQKLINRLMPVHRHQTVIVYLPSLYVKVLGDLGNQFNISIMCQC